ncbi:MAG: PAS domain S-box protein [Verrucomicrobia bacterium]|nr:PAS domain S-box protein [Verrucomicrobiota bacterium]MBI3867111.1 PAS domain S-box protein [Verrucomicrobiota bacterium]
MSSLNRAVTGVVAGGLLTFWLGWNSRATTLSAAGAIALALVMVGAWAVLAVWLSHQASAGEFTDRLRQLLDHLQSIRNQGDYSQKLRLSGDDLASKVAQELEGILEAVLRRLTDASKGRVELEQKLTDASAALAAESHKRRVAEEALRAAVTESDQRIRLRTEELTTANDALVDEVAQRTQAESAVRELHLELEQRVQDRTFELSLANEMLVKEIEDRKEAEGERQKFVSLVENANDFIALATLEGEITYLNDSGRKLLGLASDTPQPRLGVRDLEGDSSRGAFHEIILRSVVSQGSWEGEMDVRGARSDGRRVTAEVSANLLRDQETGKPICVALVLRDISDRRQSEAALKDLEERFSKAFHASPAGIAIIRLHDGRFIDVNRSLLQSLGYTRDEVVGRTMGDLSLWHSTESYSRLVELLEVQRSARDFKARWQAKSGELRDLQLAAEAMELSRESCVLLVSEDITERLKLEDQLRQSQKMEAVGQLAAGIAHDFNNILTVVQGHASLLLSDGSLAGQSTESARCVSSAAERAAKLTRQLLTFSRKQVVQWRELDLNRVVQGVATMLQSLIPATIRLSFHYTEELPLIRGDSSMLDQVLLNLAVNARDAMSRGGSLVIDTSIRLVDEEEARRSPRAKPGRFVCLTVMDTGCGMDTATMQRIFEPFFSTKDFGQGTGLGLATVYGVVTQHNGWIDVTSQVGHGSLFRVFFPALSATPSKMQDAPAEKPSELRGGEETVLVVEDEVGLRMLVEAVLQKQGYKVVLAENGVEALKQWQSHPGQIDLLLTDMVMPEGVSGLELSERVRALRSEVRVIYMSGYSVDFMENEVAGIVEGFNYLQKPYRPEQLVRAVREVLDAAPQPLPTRSAAGGPSAPPAQEAA